MDHDHVNGLIRSVLCNNCNGIEGKIFNLARRGKRDGTPYSFIQKLFEYWQRHLEHPSGVIHPLFKNADEKKARANKKARERYQRNKLKE